MRKTRDELIEEELRKRNPTLSDEEIARAMAALARRAIENRIEIEDRKPEKTLLRIEEKLDKILEVLLAKKTD